LQRQPKESPVILDTECLDNKMAKRIIYRATFVGKHKRARSPLYNIKNACLRWVSANSHRVRGELVLHEIYLNKVNTDESAVATSYEYPNLRLDREQFVSVETLLDAETFLFTLGRDALWSVLSNKEDYTLGFHIDAK
jgi:hypothetical protein